MTCPAFTRSFKLLALAIVTACTSWMVQLWWAGKLATNNQWSPANGLLWLLASLALMTLTLIAIYTSKTTLTTTELTQGWLWRKQVLCQDIAYAKLIRVKGLDWLIAPRLYVRTSMGRFSVFYAADAKLLTQAALLAPRPFGN